MLTILELVKRRATRPVSLVAALLVVLVTFGSAAPAPAEQASEPTAAVAGQLDAGTQHTCSLDAGVVRCWGVGFSGQLGNGSQETIGDDEPPGSAPPVDFGPGRFAVAISAGDFHTCAVLDDGSVRCWGLGGNGRLGYGNTANIGDDESLAAVPPVNIGTGRTAVAISAGGGHTCAVLNTGDVLCWGFGANGRLGYGDPIAIEDPPKADIGDDEQPGTLAPVQIGEGRKATAVSAGEAHTCVLLDDKNVRCWGADGLDFPGDGRLGYGPVEDPARATVGDDETPATMPHLELGGGAIAISAGELHTCAVLEGGAVRCWGRNTDGRLGYASQRRNVGLNEHPDAVGPVELGGPAAAISVGDHTCARLVSGALRCWGPGTFGQLGLSSTNHVGDDETPAAVAPVSVGGSVAAVSAGATHTCARLSDATVRCWGEGALGRLGSGSASNIGDDETPASIGAVDLRTRGVSIADATVVEGDAGETTATFTVRLSSASETVASVTYATADASAVAPADYAARSGAITFAPGETTKTVAVPVNGDTVDEPDERFTVNLANPANLRIRDGQATGTILDDDVTPQAPAPTAPGPAAPGTVADPLDEALRLQARRAADLRACRGR